MEKQILLILAGLTMSLYSCSHGGGGSTPTTVTPDSTFNGSYFQISYNSKNFNVKDVVVDSLQHWDILTSTYTSADATHNEIGIELAAPNFYGISGITVHLIGTGNTTGSFTFSSPSSWYGATSNITQSGPFVEYSDTSGTANITHNGSDYIQGTFTTTLYANGQSYPATGSFKIAH